MATIDRVRPPKVEKERETLLFDHRTLRLIVGVIAFALPAIATTLAGKVPTSISAMYHENDLARNFFVGIMAVIGTLLIAYQGHRPIYAAKDVGFVWTHLGGFLNRLTNRLRGTFDWRVKGREREEDLFSTLGGAGALAAAIYPTLRDGVKDPNTASIIHGVGAILLFSSVIYFCLFAFIRGLADKLEVADDVLGFLRATAKNTKASPNYKKAVRGRIYLLCGSIIAVVMVGLVILSIAKHYGYPVPESQNITFWAELVAMALFGVAWAAASVKIEIVRDPDEPADTPAGRAAAKQRA